MFPLHQVKVVWEVTPYNIPSASPAMFKCQYWQSIPS